METVSLHAILLIRIGATIPSFMEELLVAFPIAFSVDKGLFWAFLMVSGQY